MAVSTIYVRFAKGKIGHLLTPSNVSVNILNVWLFKFMIASLVFQMILGFVASFNIFMVAMELES
jgi:hypothetical protein